MAMPRKVVKPPLKTALPTRETASIARSSPVFFAQRRNSWATWIE